MKITQQHYNIVKNEIANTIAIHTEEQNIHFIRRIVSRPRDDYKTMIIWNLYHWIYDGNDKVREAMWNYTDAEKDVMLNQIYDELNIDYYFSKL